MKPFFYFYGAKNRLAPTYPAPEFDEIIEPFAGSAGYSVLHGRDRHVRLYDLDPVIVGLWDYLIRVRQTEILQLPMRVEHVDEIRGPPEARWLVGFWLNCGVSSPRKSISAWARDPVRTATAKFRCWGEHPRAQLDGIRRWEIKLVGYVDIPVERRATWFVDAPYEGPAGRGYKFGSKSIDFTHLGAWCRRLRGQAIVCENVGATWLPFQPHRELKGLMSRNGSGRRSSEAVWLGGAV